jgi:hypothetical protein
MISFSPFRLNSLFLVTGILSSEGNRYFLLTVDLGKDTELYEYVSSSREIIFEVVQL